jgi:hypothetical protein
MMAHCGYKPQRKKVEKEDGKDDYGNDPTERQEEVLFSIFARRQPGAAFDDHGVIQRKT